MNQTLVNRFFGQDDPIGQRIKLSMLETFREGPVPDPVFEIIGVVRDAKNQGIQEPIMPEVFVPYTLTGPSNVGFSSEPREIPSCCSTACAARSGLLTAASR